MKKKLMNINYSPLSQNEMKLIKGGVGDKTNKCCADCKGKKQCVCCVSENPCTAEDDVGATCDGILDPCPTWNPF